MFAYSHAEESSSALDPNQFIVKAMGARERLFSKPAVKLSGNWRIFGSGGLPPMLALRRCSNFVIDERCNLCRGIC